MHEKLESLFQPLRIGPMMLENRLVYPAIGAQEGRIWARLLSMRAKGGVGLIIVPDGMMLRNAGDELLHAYSDESISEMREIVRTVRHAGVKVGLQLHHPGRQSAFELQPVAPSPIPCPSVRRAPRALTVEEIQALVEDYSEAVRRARDAGFDMVEIHGAHGYLISQFLAARSNQREDAYGGSLVKRARFLVEIISRSREKVGPSFPLSCRINAVDFLEGGLTADESTQIAGLLEQAGASLINVSGGVFGYPLIIPPLYAPRAIYGDIAARIKAAVSIPVCVAGRIDDVRLADRLIQDGKADLVALGRPLMADPDLPNKARRGEFHRIRPCLYCNNGCMAKMEFRRTVSACTVNPWTDRDDMAELPPAGKVKKVLVVGGGPAGLEAARVAALRGHRVILYEQDGRLGGQWVLAAVPPHKDSFTRHLEWLISEVGLAGVEVRLKTVFTMNELHAEHPDAVVLATGALPVAPQIPGVENATVAWDVLRGKSPVGANVLIAGGSATGLEVAHLLAVQGRNVTVIEMASRFGADMPPTILWHLRRLLGEHGVRTMTNVRLREIRPDRTVTVETKGGEETWPGFSDVILATGVRPQIDLKDPIEASLSEVYVIGDAKKPRSGLDAIGEGAQAGLRL